MHKEICVKDFSGTTVSRILKFGTNIGYNYLYHVRETQHPHCLSFPLFVHFSFSPITFFVKDFSGTTSPKILYKHCVQLLVSCKRESASSCLSFPLLVHFYYAPNFKEVGGAYCFWVVHPSIRLSICHAF